MTLILALVVAPAVSVWAATDNAVPKAPQDHCEQMAAQHGQAHSGQGQAQDCCQDQETCGKCCNLCPVTGVKYGSVASLNQVYAKITTYLSAHQGLSPSGESPGLAFRPPIFHR